MKKVTARAALTVVLMAGASAPALAQQAAQGQAAQGQAAQAAVVPEVVVVGNRMALPTIPGSATILGAEVLERSQVYSVNEALRKVPGVMPREEEGLGLRPNIGIRGLNPTRSSKTLLLEDGIPLTFAPYGDNASYYHPSLERFERIEVLKGSGQIAFGPHTVGGVVNYITPNPPKETSGAIGLRGGNRDYYEATANIGGTYGQTGLLLNALRKEADGARDNIHVGVTDVTGKLVQPLGRNQAVTLKLTRYEENSQITYSGLTLAEYSADPRQNPFRNDRFDSERWGASLTHRVDFTDTVALTTAVYGSTFDRYWWRQSSNSAQRPNDSSDPRCGGMANLDTTCGNEGRLREYVAFGVEPRLSASYRTGAFDGDFLAGVRAHYEDQDRLQVNGDTPTARSAGTTANGGVREDNERKVDAYSAFVQNRFDFGRFALTPGVRMEAIDFERTNRLTGQQGSTDLTEWVPGLGATVQATEEVTLFGGVHRGFSPPRVEDVVSNAGGTVDLEAERSWNWELGLRGAAVPGVEFELAWFRMDFDNQIVPASVAGGTGAALTSAGETLHQGMELGARLDSAAMFGTEGYSVYAAGAWTWLWDAEFKGRRFSSVSGFGTVSVTGNDLPYAPEHLLSLTLGYQRDAGPGLEVEAVYTGSMYTDDLNTVAVTADGQRGRMDAYWLFNVQANWTVPGTPVTLYATAKNLFDRTVVVDRSRGSIPNNPRLLQAGAKWTF
ncbi:MAG TPA: TonB-dependent siderophore receptor [Azospirillaceae bacterium]|nr:TonB-dependent siderophore receptor [Azospirillaceae bacterium]